MRKTTLYMGYLGEDGQLVNAVHGLLHVPTDRKTLESSNELIWVRHFFKTHQKRFGRTGFFIINSDFISIGSMRDENLGTFNLIAKARPDLIKPSWKRVLGSEVLVIRI